MSDKRYTGETFENYKDRLKRQQFLRRLHQRGTLIFNSRPHAWARGVTYRRNMV